MQLDVFGAVGRKLLELLNAAHHMAVAALTLPHIQRGAPIPVAANAPILHVFQPVAKPAFADALRHPMHGVVVADQIILYRSHADKPRLSGIVDKRRIAAPAMGVTVFKHRGGKQQAALFQVFKHFFIGILAEHAGPQGFLCHFALAVHQLNKRQVVYAAHLGVVLTESRRNMHHAGTVGQCDVSRARNIPALLLRLYKIEQRLIFAVLQLFAAVALFYSISALTQHGVAQGAG